MSDITVLQECVKEYSKAKETLDEKLNTAIEETRKARKESEALSNHPA